MTKLWLAIGLLLICKKSVAEDDRRTFAWPSYHELFSHAASSASALLQRPGTFEPIVNEIKNTGGDFGKNVSHQLLQSLVKLNYVSLSETLLSFVTEHPDFANLLLSEELSKNCLFDLINLFESVKNLDTWALRVLDSWGKLPSDLLAGAIVWPGGYDECRDINVPRRNISKKIGFFRYNTTVGFTGGYCVLSVLDNTLIAAPTPEGYLLAGFNIGLCFPDTCSERTLNSMALSVEKFVNQTLAKVNLRIGGITCPKKKTGLDGPAAGSIFVAIVALVLVAFGTVYDIYRSKRDILKSEILDESSFPEDERTSGAPVKDPKRNDQEIGILGRIFCCFSLKSNIASLFLVHDAHNSSVSLRCLHGLRFLSMAWIILGHTYYFSFSMSQNPLDRLDPDKHDFFFQAIVQATYSVETFFLLSGCLVAFQFLSVADKVPEVINTFKHWLVFYIQRWFRLTLPYMLIMGVYVGLWKYVGSGPFWPEEGFEIDNCRQTWWTNLLYINNFVSYNYETHNGLVKGRQYCAAWTWYLANDMQFYILSPLFLYPLFRSRRNVNWRYVSYLVLLMAIVIGLLVTGVVASVNHLPPNMFPADLG